AGPLDWAQENESVSCSAGLAGACCPRSSSRFGAKTGARPRPRSVGTREPSSRVHLLAERSHSGRANLTSPACPSSFAHAPLCQSPRACTTTTSRGGWLVVALLTFPRGELVPLRLLVDPAPSVRSADLSTRAASGRKSALEEKQQQTEISCP
ncbi:Hypothetical predicted protein, partial [Olea europaea subsp. europaea]